LKIGLSQRILYHKGRAYDATEHGWYNYLQHHTLFFVPNLIDQDFIDIADDIELLILTGGDDSDLRRVVELRLARVMMQKGKPVLGVCHGCFLLVDVLGGQISNKPGHVGTEHVVHYNLTTKMVNSFHDSYILSLQKSAQSLCQDEDGDCEAWIDGNLAGVAWHPERMGDTWLPTEIKQLTGL